MRSDLAPISDAELDALLGRRSATRWPSVDSPSPRRCASSSASPDRSLSDASTGRWASTRTFFDRGTVDDRPEILLERVLDDRGDETFLLRTRIGYSDPELGVFLVPSVWTRSTPT